MIKISKNKVTFINSKEYSPPSFILHRQSTVIYSLIPLKVESDGW